MNILYKYLPTDIVNYVLADYLLPTEQFNNVLTEIINLNHNKHYYTFSKYYFWNYKINREKRDKKYFKDCCDSDNVYLKYNPFENDKNTASRYARYLRGQKSLQRRKKNRGNINWLMGPNLETSIWNIVDSVGYGLTRSKNKYNF